MSFVFSPAVLSRMSQRDTAALTAAIALLDDIECWWCGGDVELVPDQQVVVSIVRFAPLIDTPVFSHPQCSESQVWTRAEFERLYVQRQHRPRKSQPMVIPLEG